MPWPGCLQIFFSCRPLDSLVLTDGMHIVKEKSSIALNNFYNWILQVAWRADGASQKLIAPLWKNGSLLDHGKRNKIDFVGPSRTKRPIRIYLQTILQRFYASTILTQTPHCNSWTLAITWFFTFLSLSRIHFGLYDASNSQIAFSVYPEAL